MDSPEPTELVKQPKSSWVPALTAGGLAAVIVGLFTWPPYSVIGAIFLIFGARAWIKDSIADIARLPRHQRLSTSPIPLTGVAREKRRSESA